MASLVNPYFNKTPTNEQSLVQSLVDESIQVMGVTTYYMPRVLQNLDLVFGEDPASKFTRVMPIEMYIESPAGWEGQSEILSKFGLEIRNQLTLMVSVDRWNAEVQTIEDAMWVGDRPQEGDLIYDTITKRILEVKFVDQDSQWYQLGKMAYAYVMKCEFFQFGHEEFATGIQDIDAEAAKYNSNDLADSLSPFDSAPEFKTESDIHNFDPTDPFKDV